MGLHFVYAGAARGESGIFVTLQENRTQLARVIGRFGWSIDNPNVTIMDRSPVDMYIDELVYEMLDAIGEADARRIVIDSLNDLIAAAPDPSDSASSSTRWCNDAPSSASASCSPTRPWNCSGSLGSASSACPTSPTTSSSSNTSKTAPR